MPLINFKGLDETITKYLQPYPLSPLYSGILIVASFIISGLFFPHAYYSYSLGFVLIFSAVGFAISRQLILAVYMVLILGFHGAWLIADKTTDTRHIYQGEGIIAQHEPDKSHIFRLKLYSKDKEPIYIPTASIVHKKDPRSEYLRNIYTGNKVSLENVKLRGDSSETVIISGKNGRFKNRTFEDRYFSRSHLYEYLNARAQYYIPGSSGIYSAVLLADRRGLSHEISGNAKKLGIFHLYALSGLHVGLILGFILMLLRMVTLPVIRLNYDVRLQFIILLISLIITGSYIHLIGYPVTASRAWLIPVVWLFTSRLMGYYKWHVILLHIAGWMLAASPELIFSYGFILSFLSVAAIMTVIGFRINLPFRNNRFLSKIFEFAFKTTIISIAIFIITLPFTLQISQTVSLLMPINNIIHIAVFSVLILPLGLLCTLTGILFYGTAPNMVEGLFYSLFDLSIEIWKFLISLNIPVNRFFLIYHEFTINPVYVGLYYLIIAPPVIYLIRSNNLKQFSGADISKRVQAIRR